MFLDETIMLKYALAFSFCVITVYCGVALEMTTVTDKERAEGYACKSADPNVGLMKNGEVKNNITLDSCMRATCKAGTIQLVSCGSVFRTEGCDLVRNISLPYPLCCPRIVCYQPPKVVYLVGVFCAVALEITTVTDAEKAEGYACKSSDDALGLMKSGEVRKNYLPNSCVRSICGSDGTISYASCGVVAGPPECKIVKDYTKPYPECCPQVVCE
ncbi:Single domain von Willebrand factor type C [Popillia japonica]|uniref:Single domain von Willebrand factor type C n=1 Tax=Popillia japonica TaxID=7064 RepID=A0AAW1LSS1_POPJA